jgi:glycosyltransferase involved in cell wall biosynthesis
VVISNSFWLPVVLWPFKKRKGKLVVHVGRFPKGQMAMYRGADLLHTVSSAVGAAIEKECPALRGRIEILGYPIDTDVLCPAPSAANATRPLSVLYVGRLHPEKGVHLLVRAFRAVAARFPNAALAIVGPWESASGGGGTAYYERLVEEARGLQVTFEPPITDEGRLAERYRQASVFCYPSLAEKGETFGRAVLEAMATGLPCVVSSLQCFSDFLAHEAQGLVFDHRSAGAETLLSDALCRLLGDPALAASIGARARERATSYSLRRLAPSYIDMLRRVATPVPAP